MNFIQLIQDGEDYGLFQTTTDKDQTETIKLCRIMAEQRYEDDLEEVLELEGTFIEELEKEGITRVFVEEYNI